STRCGSYVRCVVGHMPTKGGSEMCMDMRLEASSEFAGCGEQQSGQRFLDGTDPRLTRHAALCETAGGGTHLPPAGKDEKPSREFEGRALNGRAAPVPSLLDSLTNNRHTVPDCYARPVGRGKHCGRYSIAGVDPKTG